MVENVTPWLPIIVAAAAGVGVIVAAARGMLGAYRYVKGRIVARRTNRIVATVTPLLNKRFQVVDTAMLNMRLEQQRTAKVVDEVKALVSNGLNEDVAYLRTRLDDLYDHLVG